MKLNEIPRLMDWLKTLPQQWVSDPTEWTMENFYFFQADGTVAGGERMRKKLRHYIDNKEKLADCVKYMCKECDVAAVVQATEGWMTKFTNMEIRPSEDEIMACYGPSAEAEANRKKLGLERIFVLNIVAQTDEESYYFSQQAYEKPKALGEVMKEGGIVPNHDSNGLFNNLLVKDRTNG